MNSNKNLASVVLSLFMLAGIVNAQQTDSNNQNEELGKVSWYRDYATALNKSKAENKPVLILFQEVPGCATCRKYGNNVLSNPLMVEAIENEFIPLAIFNNKGGKDKDVLKIYREPAWNNPVVRIVDYDGVDIVDRVGNNYSAKGLYTAIEEALTKNKTAIPEYIKILGKELHASNSPRSQDTYYSMYCFWTGEKSLGSQTGILNTEAGFMNGHEVVKVTYDTKETNLNTLNKYAASQKMSPIKKDNSYRQSSKDEDYYLQSSKYRFLPLTPLQRTLINSAIGSRKDAKKYLSPKQLKWLSNGSQTKETLYNTPFNKAWNMLAGS